MLVNTRNKKSWARLLPPGPRLYSALAGTPGQPSAFSWAASTWGSGHTVDRRLYADFLEEAATILGKPSLAEISPDFRAASEAWEHLAKALLPDEFALLADTRQLQLRKHQLFIQRGLIALEEIQAINARLTELRQQAEQAFPLDEKETARFRERLREQVLQVAEIEAAAIRKLQTVMA